jgi:tetratricopeptide (TPR) repeat protein
MMFPRPALGAALVILLLVAGAAAVACARWTRPIAAADAALAAGRFDEALASYALAEARLDRLPAVRQLLARDYARSAGARLWIYYQLQRYDELIEAARRSPEDAAPHYWSGLAFFAKGRAERKSEEQLGWLSRAEEELRRAVEAAPADWDTKYDYELVSRLAIALRKQPRVPPNQLMQLLRAQPRAAAKPGRRVG